MVVGNFDENIPSQPMEAAPGYCENCIGEKLLFEENEGHNPGVWLAYDFLECYGTLKSQTKGPSRWIHPVGGVRRRPSSGMLAQEPSFAIRFVYPTL